MNLDTLVRAGQPPWHPVPRAEDVDVWDKYDFPIHGTYRLDGTLVIFTLITTAGHRSLWAYVPVLPQDEHAVMEARFETEAEFNSFLKGCFAGREAVFAAAEDFIITSKSDGTFIPEGRNALLTAVAQWYISRSAAVQARLMSRLTMAGEDSDELLQAAQGALAS